MPIASLRNPPPLSRTMTLAAAARVLGVHRNTVADRLFRGLIEFEINEHGHRLPVRESVERYKAQQDRAAVAA